MQSAAALCAALCLRNGNGGVLLRQRLGRPFPHGTYGAGIRQGIFRGLLRQGCLITIAGKDQYLLVPEGETPPAGVDDSITILQQPLDNLYVAASSAMDLFDGIGALDSVHMTSTAETGWSLPNVQNAMENGTLEYAGKYSAPDYEAILSGGCELAVESTMIYHSPEIREKLETLGIPVLVEHSSYESHPLGRMEWIKLYGLLLGKTEAAESFFQAQSRKLDDICTGESTGKTVAFFYISSNGSVNVRKPGDYISKMIELAGGQYIFSADDLNVEENALSTMNIQMERSMPVQRMRIISSTTAPLTAPSAPSTSCCKRVPCWRILPLCKAETSGAPSRTCFSRPPAQQT